MEIANCNVWPIANILQYQIHYNTLQYIKIPNTKYITTQHQIPNTVQHNTIYQIPDCFPNHITHVNHNQLLCDRLVAVWIVLRRKRFWERHFQRKGLLWWGWGVGGHIHKVVLQFETLPGGQCLSQPFWSSEGSQTVPEVTLII